MEILRPKYIPNAPLILRPMTHIGVTSNGIINNLHQNVCNVQNNDAIMNVSEYFHTTNIIISLS